MRLSAKRPIAMCLRRVAELPNDPAARFNGLINERLKPKAGKDVKTP